MTSLVVDANSLWARSFFAARSISPDPAEAISLMLQSVLVLLDPNASKIGTYVDSTFFAWDSKQNPLKERDPKPQEYHDAKAVAIDVLAEFFGTVNYSLDGFEADDIVATVVEQADAKDFLYVASADKDLQQLQSKRVSYYCLNTKAELSRSFITRKWHVKRPEQVALAQAIIGDSVDNIKGIPGWGPKRCQKLFEAVTEDMDLSQAYDALAAQIPEAKMEFFLESLDRTLLKRNVPGVPKPALLQLLDPDVVDSYGISRISSLYSRVYAAYSVRD
jgi:DNA polymerase I